MRVCDVDGCARKHFGRGLCEMHYWRARRAGALPETWEKPKTKPKAQRRVEITIRSDRVRRGEDGIYPERDPTTLPRVREADLRRGRTRRAIEDKKTELHLQRMLADDDW